MYRYGFYRMARTVQASLACGADIEHLAELDRKYWLMLSCPVKAPGYVCAVSEALDTDGDGRVRVPEVLAAVAWLKPRLNGFDRLFQPAEGLSADDIRNDTDEGKTLGKLLVTLDKGGTLAGSALEGAIADFRAGVANGDGVIPVAAVEPRLAPVAEAILALTGGTLAYDGTKGIAQADLDAFDAACAAYGAWNAAKPQASADLGGLAPADAVALVGRLAPKVEAFFQSCDLVRYNPAARDALVAFDPSEGLTSAPIALPSAEVRALPVATGINPLWLADMATLGRLLDATEISPSLWAKAKTMVAPYADWAAAKPAGADVFAAFDEKTSVLAADPATRQVFVEAIAADAANAPLADAFADLRRLMVLRVGFLRFLRNFVNVAELYPPVAKPLFLVGTLYMDGRACTLCFPIAKAAEAHAVASADSKCCLIYCTLKRPAEGAERTVLAVFTAGSAGRLSVGKNGIFFDLDGKDWEATVCHVVANSISLTEAFFAPWRKAAAAFAGVVHKFIAGKNASSTSAMTAKAEGMATSATAGKAETASVSAPVGNGAMMASVATLGIALSFVATAVTGIVAALTNTPVWKIALAVLGIILVVSVPSVILTWFRLRARDLAPILNASDWAVNRTIGLTTHLGRFFTQRAVYVGQRFVRPPMRERHPLRVVLLTLVLIIVATAGAWYFFCPCSPRNCVATPTPRPACVAPAGAETASAPLPAGEVR